MLFEDREFGVAHEAGVLLDTRRELRRLQACEGSARYDLFATVIFDGRDAPECPTGNVPSWILADCSTPPVIVPGYPDGDVLNREVSGSVKHLLPASSLNS
jgi:hypothetical protein